VGSLSSFCRRQEGNCEQARSPNKNFERDAQKACASSSTFRPSHMNAWLLTWEGTTGPALVPDKKIIAILSSRRSADAIADIVDVIYCRYVHSAYDMAYLANKRKQRERDYCHLYSTSSRLFYGRVPSIFARQVTNLKIEQDLTDNCEILRWRELPVYQNAPSGGGIIVRYPAEEHDTGDR
jgi:hypothetical protein